MPPILAVQESHRLGVWTLVFEDRSIETRIVSTAQDVLDLKTYLYVTLAARIINRLVFLKWGR